MASNSNNTNSGEQPYEQIESQTFYLGKKKRVTVTIWRDNVYAHFNDNYSRKSITFSGLEMFALLKALPKYLRYINTIAQKHHIDIRPKKTMLESDFKYEVSDQGQKPVEKKKYILDPIEEDFQHLDIDI